MKNIKILIIAAITMLSTITYGKSESYEDTLKYHTDNCDGILYLYLLPFVESYDIGTDSANQILKTNEVYLPLLKEKAKRSKGCQLYLQHIQQLEDAVKNLIAKAPDLADTPLGEAITYMQEEEKKKSQMD